MRSATTLKGTKFQNKHGLTNDGNHGSNASGASHHSARIAAQMQRESSNNSERDLSSNQGSATVRRRDEKENARKSSYFTKAQKNLAQGAMTSNCQRNHLSSQVKGKQ